MRAGMPVGTRAGKRVRMVVAYTLKENRGVDMAQTLIRFVMVDDWGKIERPNPLEDREVFCQQGALCVPAVGEVVLLPKLQSDGNISLPVEFEEYVVAGRRFAYFQAANIETRPERSIDDVEVFLYVRPNPAAGSDVVAEMLG
jgi:hypothetical protein